MLIRYRRFYYSISYIDIGGIRYRITPESISKVENHRYRRSQTGMPISKFCLFDIVHNYSISCFDIVYDIGGFSHNRYRVLIVRYRTSEYRNRYSIRYCIHPMSFTAERKLPLPRRLHAGAEGSQRHEPWIPAPSFCAIPQLDPQRFDEERSFHSATSTC